MLPRIVRIPFDVEYTNDDYELSVTPPDHARLGAVFITVDQKAALYDHQVAAIEHFRRKHLTPHTVSGTDYGAPLGHVAGTFDPSVYDAASPRVLPFRPWPGLINNFVDFDWLRGRYARGEQLNLHEQFRLANFGKLPCRDFSMIRLQPQHEFKVSGSRIYGETAISKAYLHCIVLDDTDYALFERQEHADFVDSPHWLVHALILAAAAGVGSGAEERKFNAPAQAKLGLQVLATMAMAHENNAGTIAYNEAYLAAVLLRFTGNDNNSIFPSFADQRQLLTELSTQILQEVDPCRRLGLWVPWNGRYHVETQRTVTTYQKDVRMTHYGLLKPSNSLGEMVDPPAICAC